MTILITTIQVSLPQLTPQNFHLRLYPFSFHPFSYLLIRLRGDQLGAWTSNYLSFSNPFFIIVAHIGHIVGLWLFKCTGWGYNSDSDTHQRRATGEKEEGKGREALRISCVRTVRTFVRDAQKISTRATKRLLLMPHCFGIIKICERFGISRPTLQTIFVSVNVAITPGPQLRVFTSNYLSFSNPLFIIVARIGHIVSLWSEGTHWRLFKRS